jgi:hypothetical protein
MSQKITLRVNGEPRELTADFLGQGALEYWQAWLSNAARIKHNPLVEFAAKVQALPEHLQIAATREFMANIDFDIVPKVIVMQTLRSLPAMKTLCILVTGEDVVCEENLAAAFPLLLPFIQRQEFLADSIAAANRLRAEVGKPPIGKPATSNVAADKAPADSPPSDQSPQGG